MAFRFGLRWISLALASFLGAPLLAVELPSIRLDTVFPPGGRAGSDLEVNITGNELDELDGMRFSDPRITAKPKGDKHFVVTIAPDVPPGIYDSRITGLSGVSNPRGFVVGDLPETVKGKANNDRASAAEVAIGSVYSGSATQGAYDWFKFTAKKDQRLMIECAGPEIDSRMSSVITVQDAGGNELGASRKGGFLDFAAPVDGEYFLTICDLTFAGGPEYYYRVSISAGPHIDSIFPLAGFTQPTLLPKDGTPDPGAKSKLTLYGRNLPGGKPANRLGFDGKPLEELEVEVAAPSLAACRQDGLTGIASATVGGFSYRLKTPQGVSNPVFVAYSGLPAVAEQKPNGASEKAQKITTPCEIDGEFFPANEEHWFSFEAKKGEKWGVEVVSQRLGMQTDPAIVIKQGEKGETDVAASTSQEGAIAPRRFHTASNDPVLRFEAKEDGVYRVMLSDLYASGVAPGDARHDPRKAFRLVVSKDTPGFDLLAAVEPPPEKADDRIAVPNAPLVRANGVTAIHVYAFRRGGFDGDIELTAEGLPTGVTCAATKIPAGKPDGWMLLLAVEKPERWVGSICVMGKAKTEPDVVTVATARTGSVVWQATDMGNDRVRSRLARDFALAVSAKEAVPVSVQPAEEKVWEAVAGAKLEIPLKIARHGEFKDALKLKGFGAPGIEALKDVDLAGDAGTVTIDLAAVKIPPGEHIIYFQSPMKGKFRGKDVSTVVYSEPIRIAIKAPEAKKP